MSGFVDAVKMFYARYTDFKGRSSRSQYWWVQLYMLLACLVLGAIGMILSGGPQKFERALNSGQMSLGGMIFFGLIGIFLLANVIPAIALVVRRFHDLGYTGWLYLIFIVLSLIPIVGMLVSLGMIVWFCFRGTIGPNKYGPDPLGGGEQIFD